MATLIEDVGMGWGLDLKSQIDRAHLRLQYVLNAERRGDRHNALENIHWLRAQVTTLEQYINAQPRGDN